MAVFLFSTFLLRFDKIEFGGSEVSRGDARGE